MRHASVLIGVLSLWLASGPAAAGSPFPITTLVLEGDAVGGVGLVTRIDNLAVNSLGDWLVEVDTDLADADTVLLLNGSLYLRENGSVSAPFGSRIDSFDSVNLNLNGDSGWNLFLAGPPIGEDSGLYAVILTGPPPARY